MLHQGPYIQITSSAPQCPNVFSSFIHVKFQALQRKFGQSIAQEVQKSIVLGQKSTVTYGQSNLNFFVNILILKDNSSFDQGLNMIHQGLLKIHQDSKVAKLGFCRKSQLNFDQA